MVLKRHRIKLTNHQVKAKPVGVDGDTAGTYFCDKYNILATLS
jgi:hypothetical protein